MHLCFCAYGAQGLNSELCAAQMLFFATLPHQRMQLPSRSTVHRASVHRRSVQTSSSANTCFTMHPGIGAHTRPAAMHRRHPHVAQERNLPKHSNGVLIEPVHSVVDKNIYKNTCDTISPKLTKTHLLLKSFLTHIAEHYQFWG